MIHHPQATPMKVSQKNCTLKVEEDNFLNHRCDTQPGSSGSAILLPNYEHPEESRVVGVHTLGGCDDEEESTNSGPSMRHLVEISPTLKSLAKK
jgi:V8-like Glu-specific endopeptidase